MPFPPTTEQSLSHLNGTFSLAIAWTCTHRRRITAGYAYDRHCRSTAYAYDDSARKSKAYDGVGLATAYVYDVFGRLLSLTYGTKVSVAHAYDGLGRVAAATVRASRLTTCAYDTVAQEVGDGKPPSSKPFPTHLNQPEERFP